MIGFFKNRPPRTSSGSLRNKSWAMSASLNTLVSFCTTLPRDPLRNVSPTISPNSRAARRFGSPTSLPAVARRRRLANVVITSSADLPLRAAISIASSSSRVAITSSVNSRAPPTRENTPAPPTYDNGSATTSNPRAATYFGRRSRKSSSSLTLKMSPPVIANSPRAERIADSIGLYLRKSSSSKPRASPIRAVAARNGIARMPFSGSSTEEIRPGLVFLACLPLSASIPTLLVCSEVSPDRMLLRDLSEVVLTGSIDFTPR